MTMIRTSRPAITLLVAVWLYSGLGSLGAQGFASADAARDLTYLLDQMGLTSFAAVDTMAPGTFVAALYIPGSQLLIVRARHPSVDAVRYRIGLREYRDVYLDLQGSPARAGKFFVQDSGADGILSAQPGAAVDVLYEDGVRQTQFNGRARAQDLRPSEYDAKLTAADREYARLLTLLTTTLQQRQKMSDP